MGANDNGWDGYGYGGTYDLSVKSCCGVALGARCQLDCPNSPPVLCDECNATDIDDCDCEAQP